jgi:hypothetical protein
MEAWLRIYENPRYCKRVLEETSSLTGGVSNFKPDLTRLNSRFINSRSHGYRESGSWWIIPWVAS